LFTTLDPLSKSLVLPNGEHIVISDTVGFLNNLPHHLIEAFKATLEEVLEADLLVHVLDAHHARVYEQNQAVISVLEQLEVADKPRIVALNKIDLLDDKTWLEKIIQDFAPAVPISAKLSYNLDLLLAEIEKRFAQNLISLYIQIPHARMDLVDLFYREGKVKEIKYLDKGIQIKVDLPKILSQKLLQNKEIEIL
jgi:GTP-binding protein HflX